MTEEIYEERINCEVEGAGVVTLVYIELVPAVFQQLPDRTKAASAALRRELGELLVVPPLDQSRGTGAKQGSWDIPVHLKGCGVN